MEDFQPDTATGGEKKSTQKLDNNAGSVSLLIRISHKVGQCGEGGWGGSGGLEGGCKGIGVPCSLNSLCDSSFIGRGKESEGVFLSQQPATLKVLLLFTFLPATLLHDLPATEPQQVAGQEPPPDDPARRGRE